MSNQEEIKDNIKILKKIDELTTELNQLKKNFDDPQNYEILKKIEKITSEFNQLKKNFGGEKILIGAKRASHTNEIVKKTRVEKKKKVVKNEERIFFYDELTGENNLKNYEDSSQAFKLKKGNLFESYQRHFRKFFSTAVLNKKLSYILVNPFESLNSDTEFLNKHHISSFEYRIVHICEELYEKYSKFGLLILNPKNKEDSEKEANSTKKFTVLVGKVNFKYHHETEKSIEETEEELDREKDLLELKLKYGKNFPSKEYDFDENENEDEDEEEDEDEDDNDEDFKKLDIEGLDMVEYLIHMEKVEMELIKEIGLDHSRRAYEHLIVTAFHDELYDLMHQYVPKNGNKFAIDCSVSIEYSS